METRTAPLIGGRYRIDGPLGEGGMARVFDAFDERLERPVAVKIMRAEIRALPGMRQRFQQEALIAARLTHPHIVAVLDFGEDPSCSYLVMDRLPGTTLRDEIVARGPLPTGRVALVMAETLTALTAAHAHGVLHRDIKPSNILLQQDGHTKISDFGIAKSFDARTNRREDMTMTGVILGTPGYLAPERRSGQPATVQSDLYAVGAVMLEALRGQRLGPEVAPADDLASPWAEVASRALAPDPRHRFRSASDMLQALGISTTGFRPAARPQQAPMSVTTAVRVPIPDGRPPLPSSSTSLSRAPARLETRSRARRRRVALAFVAALVLAAALFVLLAGYARPTGPATTIAQHHAADPQTQALARPTTTPSTADTESAAITSLATSLAKGGFPGDGALASALQATAAAPPGADRESSAQQTLSLAGVLLGGGGITSGQYRDVVSVLEPTGATVTTTTVSPPADPFLAPFGHLHSHGRGDGEGDRG